MRLNEESDFRSHVMHIINDWPNSHACAIESPLLTAGFPDMNFCINGKEGNVEFKRVTGTYDPEIRPSQFKWMAKRDKAGGNVCYMCLADTEECQWIYATRNVQNLLLRGKVGTLAWQKVAQCMWRVDDYLPGKLINFLRTT